MDANKASTDAVKSAVDANKASTDAVKSAVDANKASTDAVKSAVDANKASTDAVKGSVDGAKDALGGKLDGIKSGVDRAGDKLGEIKDALTREPGTGRAPDPSELTDNPEDQKLSDDKPDEERKAPEAKANVKRAFDRLLASADRLSSRSGLKSYLEGFFPTASGSGGCPPPFAVRVPILNQVDIQVPCPIVRIVGDAIFLVSIAKAFKIAREGG